MKRRQFMLISGGAFALSPLAALAQQPAKIVRIGVLTISIGPATRVAAAFRQALLERGYVEGRNIALDYRFAAGRADRLPILAAELVRTNVDIIVTESAAAALAAKQATRTIPIVMAITADPVGSGLVANLARPGANITGFSFTMDGVEEKRLQFLKEVAPNADIVGLIWNPSNPTLQFRLREIEAAARLLSIRLFAVEARSPADLDAAFKALVGARAAALFTFGDGMLLSQRSLIVEFAQNNRLPAIFADREFAEAGGLMTYGPNLALHFGRAAEYVDKILKGAKPAELPVEQASKFELVINLKTAKNLGIAVPEAILVSANEVIE